MPKVFVTRQIPETGLNLLSDTFGKENITIAPQDAPIAREALLDGVPGMDALLPILTDPIDGEVMDAAGPQLKVIANYAVGYNNIDVEAATKRGIAVTNTPGVLTETTADLAWALLMAAARRLGEAERLVRNMQWGGWSPTLLLGVDIFGKILGIYGMGRIGQAVARRAQGFNMRVIYTSRSEADLPDGLQATRVDKETLLKESDFLSIHCPLSEKTTHLFGATEFKAMKKSAVLINTARGPIVDEAALVHALQSKEIFAAGLDVFEEEPKIHEDLFNCPNAVLIPHLGSATEETRGKMAEIAARNIIARLEGQEPPDCINPTVLK